MKTLKKLASLVLAAVMVLAMSIPVMAANNTGTITITENTASETAAPIGGRTFEAYRILKLEMNGSGGVVYKVPAEWKEFFTTGQFEELKSKASKASFDEDVAKIISGWKDDSSELETFTKNAWNYISEKNINATATTTASAWAMRAQFTNLEYGYYLIKDTTNADDQVTSALMLDSTTPDAHITLKASQPTIDKSIVGSTGGDSYPSYLPKDKADTDESTEGLVDTDNGAIGDVIPYVIATQVPDMRGYSSYQFIITDTLSKGLTYNADLKMYINGTEVNVSGNLTTLDETDKDGGKTGNKIIKITFDNLKSFISSNCEGAKAGDPIYVYYTATINDKAVIGTTGNLNNVNLQYSRNPNWSGDGDGSTGTEPLGKTPDSTVKTYVTGIKLEKVAASEGETKTRLTGAKFTITGTKIKQIVVTKDSFTQSDDGEYWKLKDGTYTTDDPNTENMDTTQYVDTTTKYSKTTSTETQTQTEDVTVTGEVGGDGTLIFAGLAAGSYEITEIQSPTGYNILKNPIKLTITCDDANDSTNGNCTWSGKYTTDGTDVTDESTALTFKDDLGEFFLQVENSTGTELPSTGGIGTTIFYVIGGILVVGAAILLVAKKRMNTESK